MARADRAFDQEKEEPKRLERWGSFKQRIASISARENAVDDAIWDNNDNAFLEEVAQSSSAVDRSKAQSASGIGRANSSPTSTFFRHSVSDSSRIRNVVPQRNSTYVPSSSPTSTAFEELLPISPGAYAPMGISSSHRVVNSRRERPPSNASSSLSGRGSGATLSSPSEASRRSSGLTYPSPASSWDMDRALRKSNAAARSPSNASAALPSFAFKSLDDSNLVLDPTDPEPRLQASVQSSSSSITRGQGHHEPAPVGGIAKSGTSSKRGSDAEPELFEPLNLDALQLSMPSTPTEAESSDDPAAVQTNLPEPSPTSFEFPNLNEESLAFSVPPAVVPTSLPQTHVEQRPAPSSTPRVPPKSPPLRMAAPISSDSYRMPNQMPRDVRSRPSSASGLASTLKKIMTKRDKKRGKGHSSQAASLSASPRTVTDDVQIVRARTSLDDQVELSRAEVFHRQNAFSSQNLGGSSNNSHHALPVSSHLRDPNVETGPRVSRLMHFPRKSFGHSRNSSRTSVIEHTSFDEARRGHGWMGPVPMPSKTASGEEVEVLQGAEGSTGTATPEGAVWTRTPPARPPRLSGPNIQGSTGGSDALRSSSDSIRSMPVSFSPLMSARGELWPLPGTGAYVAENGKSPLSPAFSSPGIASRSPGVSGQSFSHLPSKSFDSRPQSRGKSPADNSARLSFSSSDSRRWSNLISPKLSGSSSAKVRNSTISRPMSVSSSALAEMVDGDDQDAYSTGASSPAPAVSSFSNAMDNYTLPEQSSRFSRTRYGSNSSAPISLSPDPRLMGYPDPRRPLGGSEAPLSSYALHTVTTSPSPRLSMRPSSAGSHHKRPSFGLNISPAAAQAFDSIPSPLPPLSRSPHPPLLPDRTSVQPPEANGMRRAPDIEEQEVELLDDRIAGGVDLVHHIGGPLNQAMGVGTGPAHGLGLDASPSTSAALVHASQGAAGTKNGEHDDMGLQLLGINERPSSRASSRGSVTGLGIEGAEQLRRSYVFV